jgi:hypothetical protein
MLVSKTVSSFTSLRNAMTITSELDQLRKYREKHFELGSRFIEAGGGDFFPLDILFVAALNRSLCLLKAFIELIQSNNLIAAAPLIRLQLDNCLRISATTRVEDPHGFAISILEGKSIKKQRDISKKLMTDSYLLGKLATRYPWMPDLYDYTSGYIHLSEKHIFNAIQASDKEYSLNLKITDKDVYISDEVYLGAIYAFRRSTDALFDYVQGWIYTKENPEESKKRWQMWRDQQNQKQ